MAPAIDIARSACADHRWGDAWRALSPVQTRTLDVDDLDLLATAAYLTGRNAESFAHWGQAHERCVEDGSIHRAAHFGMRLAQAFGFTGDLARCRGWVDRTARLLNDAEIDCVEQGYLEHAEGMLRVFDAGDMAGAHAHFLKAGKIGARFGHRELVTLARIGAGRMLIYLGEIAEGIAFLDEAMVSIEARELSPMATGDAYCTVIDACAELCDVTRCRSWSESFLQWCDTQQELVLYRGHCFLHRAEVLETLGSWTEALTEARCACDRLAAPVNPVALAAASVVEGDILRLLGDHDGAEAAYERAIEWGRQPQPGLSLLRLAQGRFDAAAAMIRRVLGETEGPIFRARLLDGFATIMHSAGDLDAAGDAARELRTIAAELGTPLLHAQAARASGAVLLADGDASAALPHLRTAFNELNALGVRFEAARTRALIAEACAALGDHDAARLESNSARAILDSLPVAVASGATQGPLTARERDVLRLLARGKTNRVTAGELVISEKTVASHVAHIFTKLDVTTRSAATAYAYDHGLT